MYHILDPEFIFHYFAGSVDEEHSFKSKRRKLKELDNRNSDSDSTGSNKS